MRDRGKREERQKGVEMFVGREKRQKLWLTLEVLTLLSAPHARRNREDKRITRGSVDAKKKKEELQH